jgi:DNA invertase Pin-like site-specific DNA recombinase
MTEQEKKQIISMWESRMTILDIVRTLPYTQREARRMINELRADGTLKPRKKKRMLNEAIMEIFNSGTTDRYEIAEILGVSYRTVLNRLQKMGIHLGRPAHNHKKMPIKDTTAQIMDDIRKGEMSYSQIAKKYGVSRGRVGNIKQQMIKRKEI